MGECESFFYDEKHSGLLKFSSGPRGRHYFLNGDLERESRLAGVIFHGDGFRELI